MNSQRVPGGVVHSLPRDLCHSLIANVTALESWKDITPLARNEFICWVGDAKQRVTRQRRIRRAQEQLEESQRRPCCWPGCAHRERSGKKTLARCSVGKFIRVARGLRVEPTEQLRRRVQGPDHLEQVSVGVLGEVVGERTQFQRRGAAREVDPGHLGTRDQVQRLGRLALRTFVELEVVRGSGCTLNFEANPLTVAVPFAVTTTDWAWMKASAIRVTHQGASVVVVVLGVTTQSPQMTRSREGKSLKVAQSITPGGPGAEPTTRHGDWPARSKNSG